MAFQNVIFHQNRLRNTGDSGAFQMKFEPERKSHNFGKKKKKSLRNAQDLVNLVQILSKWTETAYYKKYLNRNGVPAE
jgi:hypothetical protein